MEQEPKIIVHGGGCASLGTGGPPGFARIKQPQYVEAKELFVDRMGSLGAPALGGPGG